MKRCNKCQETKDDKAFHIKRYKSGHIGLRAYCIPCSQKERDAWRKSSTKDNDRNKAYNRENARKIRAERLRKYWPNSTWQEAEANYEKLRKQQNNLCSICHKAESRLNALTNKPWELAVDHNHATLAVRGLLCNSCNRGIGLFGDNINVIENLVLYLKNT
jgi:hypothetical protein